MRQAIVQIDIEIFLRSLGMPKDARVLAMDVPFDGSGHRLHVKVEHESFIPTINGGVLPRGSIVVRRLESGGVEFVRFDV